MQAIDVNNLFQDIRENYEKYANSDALEEQFLAMRFKQIEQYIKTFPVVEVVPVKHGKWENVVTSGSVLFAKQE